MTTPRLGLYELLQNQTQPHVPVNTAMRRLDALVQMVVQDRDLTAPPGSAVDGDSHIIAGPATGDWLGKEDYLAYYYGGWQYIAPFNGMKAFIEIENVDVRYKTDVSPVGWYAVSDSGGSIVAGGDGEIIFDKSVSAAPGAAVTDYNPTGWNGGNVKNRLRVTPNAGGTTLNSLDATNCVDGQTVLLCNEDAAELLTVPNGAAGVAANTFEGPGGGDVVILAKQCRLITRVGTRWRFT